MPAPGEKPFGVGRGLRVIEVADVRRRARASEPLGDCSTDPLDRPVYHSDLARASLRSHRVSERELGHRRTEDLGEQSGAGRQTSANQ